MNKKTKSLLASLYILSLPALAQSGTIRLPPGGGSGEMDYSYIDAYPYSRCEMENIAAEECKKFGYIYGTDTVTANEAIQLMSGTHENSYKHSMNKDNYNVENWSTPTPDHLEFALEKNLLEENTVYITMIDGQYELAGTDSSVPDEFDGNIQVKMLMVSIDAEKRPPQNIIVTEPEPNYVCGNVVDDTSQNTTGGNCLKIAEMIEGPEVTVVWYTSSPSTQMANTFGFTEGDNYVFNYKKTTTSSGSDPAGIYANFYYKQAQSWCDRLSEMKFAGKSNWQTATLDELSSLYNAKGDMANYGWPTSEEYFGMFNTSSFYITLNNGLTYSNSDLSQTDYHAQQSCKSVVSRGNEYPLIYPTEF